MAAIGRGQSCTADCLRERWQPVAGESGVARARTGDAGGARRWSRAAGAAMLGGEHGARFGGRTVGSPAGNARSPSFYRVLAWQFATGGRGGAGLAGSGVRARGLTRKRIAVRFSS